MSVSKKDKLKAAETSAFFGLRDACRDVDASVQAWTATVGGNPEARAKAKAVFLADQAAEKAARVKYCAARTAYDEFKAAKNVVSPNNK